MPLIVLPLKDEMYDALEEVRQKRRLSSVAEAALEAIHEFLSKTDN